MAAPLSPLPSPIGIVPSCIPTSTTTLSIGPDVQRIDKWFWNANVVPPDLDSSNEPVIEKLTSSPEKAKSSRLFPPSRVYVKDSNGIVLLQIRRSRWRGRWVYRLNVPIETGYKLVGTSASATYRVTTFWRLKFDVTIDNLAGDGNPVTLEIRRPNKKDNPANCYLHVIVAGNIAMRLTTTRHPGSFLVGRWNAEVATGFDMTLAVVIVTILEIWHGERQSATRNSSLNTSLTLTLAASMLLI
ncbi:hypothetical protein D6D08_00418 [Aureobasidium pullulans]|nr:hypothetical protein D6D08_00418 [Aureobasidium pullulans]